MEAVTSPLFGTDGIRGQANALLTPEFAIKLARAAAVTCLQPGDHVIIGRDTRLSGPMLESALASGFASAGAHVSLAGVIPTPAISYLIKDERAALGAVISASHNPPRDNGIKLFDRNGRKLSVETERAVEAALTKDVPTFNRVGSLQPLDSAATRYAAFLSGAIDSENVDLSDTTIVVDCAHGATGHIAPHVFRHLGARVIELNTAPDGARINVECGSTDLRAVEAAVRTHNADLGVAFDGDGDRVMLIGADGKVIDGDRMLGIAGRHMLESGELSPPLIVATVMTNAGLEEWLRRQGIALERTEVGDRNVSCTMEDLGACLGGEQSGHIIFSRHSPTGDGILTAVKLLEIAHEAGRSLGSLCADIVLYPQAHRRIPAADPARVVARTDVQSLVAEAQRTLAPGRIIVRPSGTQPVIRVTVEAPEADECEARADELSAAIESSLIAER